MLLLNGRYTRFGSWKALLVSDVFMTNRRRECSVMYAEYRMVSCLDNTVQVQTQAVSEIVKEDHLGGQRSL